MPLQPIARAAERDQTNHHQFMLPVFKFKWLLESVTETEEHDEDF
jgi:hypothetical protein